MRFEIKSSGVAASDRDSRHTAWSHSRVSGANPGSCNLESRESSRCVPSTREVYLLHALHHSAVWRCATFFDPVNEPSRTRPSSWASPPSSALFFSVSTNRSKSSSSTSANISPLPLRFSISTASCVYRNADRQSTSAAVRPAVSILSTYSCVPVLLSSLGRCRCPRSTVSFVMHFCRLLFVRSRSAAAMAIFPAGPIFCPLMSIDVSSGSVDIAAAIRIASAASSPALLHCSSTTASSLVGTAKPLERLNPMLRNLNDGARLSCDATSVAPFTPISPLPHSLRASIVGKSASECAITSAQSSVRPASERSRLRMKVEAINSDASPEESFLSRPSLLVVVVSGLPERSRSVTSGERMMLSARQTSARG